MNIEPADVACAGRAGPPWPAAAMRRLLFALVCVRWMAAAPQPPPQPQPRPCEPA
jgi:hypothetical protein